MEAAFVEPFVLTDVELHTGASIGVAFTGGDRPAGRARGAPAQRRSGDVQDKRERGEDRTVSTCASCIAPTARSTSSRTCASGGQGSLHDGSQLYLEYQPIVSAKTGRIIGIEALLRWNHPSRGVMVAPSVLIPLAERCGLIVEIGQWVLEQARADDRAWHATQASEPRTVGQRLRAPADVGRLREVRGELSWRTPRPTLDLLTLEMTESVFVRDPERALTVLNDVKDMGVKLALDDFGTGTPR